MCNGTVTLVTIHKIENYFHILSYSSLFPWKQMIYHSLIQHMKWGRSLNSDYRNAKPTAIQDTKAMLNHCNYRPCHPEILHLKRKWWPRLTVCSIWWKLIKHTSFNPCNLITKLTSVSADQLPIHINLQERCTKSKTFWKHQNESIKYTGTIHSSIWKFSKSMSQGKKVGHQQNRKHHKSRKAKQAEDSHLLESKQNMKWRKEKETKETQNWIITPERRTTAGGRRRSRSGWSRSGRRGGRTRTRSVGSSRWSGEAVLFNWKVRWRGRRVAGGGAVVKT